MENLDENPRDGTNPYFKDVFNNDGYRFPFNKAGSRIFSDVQFPISITPAEIGRMTILSKLMIAGTNMLGYRQDTKIYAYTYDEIIDLARLRRSQGSSFMCKMIRLHLMQRVQTTSGPQYYINPAYFMASGQRLNLNLFLLFKDDLMPILPDWVLRGFLTQVREKKVSQSAIITEVEKIFDNVI